MAFPTSVTFTHWRPIFITSLHAHTTLEVPPFATQYALVALECPVTRTTARAKVLGAFAYFASTVYERTDDVVEFARERISTFSTIGANAVFNLLLRFRAICMTGVGVEVEEEFALAPQTLLSKLFLFKRALVALFVGVFVVGRGALAAFSCLERSPRLACKGLQALASEQTGSNRRELWGTVRDAFAIVHVEAVSAGSARLRKSLLRAVVAVGNGTPAWEASHRCSLVLSALAVDLGLANTKVRAGDRARFALG